MVKVELQADVLMNNNISAEYNRQLFQAHKTLVINLMSSPGAGKTSLLIATINKLLPKYRVAVIEGDLATDRDAERIRTTGVQTRQINTHGGCHLDARMIAAVLPEFSLAAIDILFIENVGNLVCPSGFDLGQTHKVAVLSVPEGNDKIEKYPTMFSRTELVLLNKIDLLPVIDFDVEEARTDLQNVNPTSTLIEISAKTGSGMDTWLSWIKERLKKYD